MPFTDFWYSPVGVVSAATRELRLALPKIDAGGLWVCIVDPPKPEQLQMLLGCGEVALHDFFNVQRFGRPIARIPTGPMPQEGGQQKVQPLPILAFRKGWTAMLTFKDGIGVAWSNFPGELRIRLVGVGKKVL